MANGVYIGIDSDSFTNNPAPITGWTTDSYSNSTANNSYGTWEIQATSSYGSSSYSVDKAFDGAADTAYITNTLTSDEQEEYLYLILPDGLSIKPSKISAKFNNSGTSTYPCYVQGYNGTDWVNLATLTSTYKTTEETYNITTSEYYTQFRLTLHRYSSTKTAVYIYSFEITSGETKLSSGLAHKVKAMYVGVDGVARKVKKGYIGVNGVAKLFYDSATYIPFTVCPYRVAASSWVSVKNYTEYTYTNDYGVWRAKATGTDSSSNPAYYAFDTSSSTSWKNSKGGDTLTIEFPKGVTINPTQIKATGTDNTVVGFNIYGVKTDGTQEQLVFYDDDQSFSETFDIKTDSYFTQLVFATGVDGTRTTLVKQFFVENGTIRID